MATRVKTVEYVFPARVTSLAATTRNDFGAITLQIPETYGRTFLKVAVEVSLSGAETAATSITAWLIGIKLGAVAFSDATVTATPTHSSKQQTHKFCRDVTSYFQSNYGSLPEQTCQVGVTFTTLPTINISVKLIITYQASDTDLLTSNTASSGGATTLVTTGAGWTVNAWNGQYVKIISGTGSGQVRKIISNTSDTLTVAAWVTPPDGTSGYQIRLGHLKTVRIPIESGKTTLTAALAEIGTNQVPLLDTFLPEANKGYNDIFFDIFSDDAGVSTTNLQLGLQLDAEAETSMGIVPKNLNNACSQEIIWKRTDLNTAATHAFKARDKVQTTRWACTGAILTVTYTYFLPDTTTVMNSIMGAMSDAGGWIGSTLLGDRERIRQEIWIEEPATITLKQSAFIVMFNQYGATTLQVAGGAQAGVAFIQYAIPAGTTDSGTRTIIHRIDGGGASATAALALARGSNKLDLEMYVSNALDGAGYSAMFILNYTSAIHTDGPEVHNKTILWYGGNGLAGANRLTMSAFAPSIVESAYFLNNVTLRENVVTYSKQYRNARWAKAEQLSDAGNQEGWVCVMAKFDSSDDETNILEFQEGINTFYRYIGDSVMFNPGRCMDLLTPRKYFCDNTNSAVFTGFWINFTYHSIGFTVSGNVKGFTGNGAGITVDLMRSDNMEKLLTTTTTVGGAYSFKWFDNTIPVFACVRQADGYVGRSNQGVAS
jgi:hypothetical protein